MLRNVTKSMELMRSKKFVRIKMDKPNPKKRKKAGTLRRKGS
jgi:hypothetical protein